MKDQLLIHIAFLFYAIAKSDKTLSFEESIRLSEVLNESWRHIDNAKLIKDEFIKLQKTHISASLAFNKFVEFLHTHPNLFNKKIQTLIINSANEIAYSFSKINKSELFYLAKLSMEFKKIGTLNIQS